MAKDFLPLFSLGHARFSVAIRLFAYARRGRWRQSAGRADARHQLSIIEYFVCAYRCTQHMARAFDRGDAQSVLSGAWLWSIALDTLTRACKLDTMRSVCIGFGAKKMRRCGREVEGTPLLREHVVKARIEGSNPSVSADFLLN